MTHPFISILDGSKNARQKPSSVGRGNSRPHFHFRFDDNWTFSRQASPSLRLAKDFNKIAFDVNLVALTLQAHRRLSRLEADFAWLAIAVYLADRFAPRHPYGMNGPVFWRRHLHLSIPISDPERWQGAMKPLIHALSFLTEDDWSFEFIAGRKLFDAENQEHFRLVLNSVENWTALFSGGLDSLAGAVRQFQRTLGTGLLVSGQTHNRIALGQDDQVAALRNHFPDRIEHVGIGYGIPNKKGLIGFESSQRTRAFIHVALGSLAAIMSGGEKLFLFENGFGALNLPCDTAQIGSQNSRGTHPVFLRRMAAFVTAAFSHPFTIENPYIFSTKSQMLLGTSMSAFGDLFQKTFSCDRFPNYHHKAQQCGYCPSCLVRRLSLYCAGQPDNRDNYSLDIFSSHRPQRESELLALTKLSIQAETLGSHLRSADPWRALSTTWPDLLRSEIEIASPLFRDNTIDLLLRHVEEWESFSRAAGKTPLALAA